MADVPNFALNGLRMKDNGDGTYDLYVIADVAIDSSGLATATKQDTLNAKDFATQTTLAALLAKIIAAPATEAKQDTIITALGTLATALGVTNGHLATLEAGLPYHV